MATPDAPSRPSCPLGVSTRTLSAFRDDALGRPEAARLASHVETCAACRDRLSAFSALSSRLRSERPPEPDDRLWQSVATAATSTKRAPLPRLRYGHRVRAGLSRPAMRGLRAIAAAILVTVGLVTLLMLHRPHAPTQQVPTATPAPATPSPSPTSTATPSLLAPHPLTWRPVGLPNGVTQLGALRPAGDGESAYACVVGSDAHGDSTVAIWHTSDRGTDWSPARVVPSEPNANGCELVVDASDPSVAALAWVPRGGGAGDPYTGLMTTVDSGVTWQDASSSPPEQIDQLDSRDGEIFALRETVDSSGSAGYHLWASSDRMRTWRQVDRGISQGALLDDAGFWLQPDGAGILLVLGGATGAPSQLWIASDGATWRQLTAPGTLPTFWPARYASLGVPANGIVARSLQGQFHICVAAVMPVNNGQVLTCTVDGGQTWQARTALPFAANLVDITSDGALLASGPGALFRLAGGSAQWQPLGALPQPIVVYCPTPELGILWAVPAATGANGDPPAVAAYTA